MNWADAIKNRAKAALRERSMPTDSAFDTVRPTSWDPYEVWLTRIKKPRDLAAGSGPGVDTGASGRSTSGGN